MHEYNPRDLANLYQNPLTAPPLECARDDFREFFQSNEKFSEVAKHIETELVTYARFCRSVGDEQVKALVSSAVNYAWRALVVNKDETMKVLAHSALDGDIATTTFWSLLKRYPNMPWKDETNLLRDRVSDLLAFASEIIEGVLKREMWSKLALRDIANRSTKNPLRWQTEVLGNIISSISALPSPLGDFIGKEPLPGITLNQFRNIGAHKDFSVVKNVITLFPRTEKVVVSLQDLENALEIVGGIRVPLRLSNIIANLNDIGGLISAGYVPNDSPEAVAISLASSLAVRGIILKNIRYENHDTEITCLTNQEYTNENILFEVLRHIGEFIYAYENTFERTSSSKIKVAITKSDGTVIEVSCNIDETLTYLNTTGHSEIPFEVKINGVAGIVKLKVNIGDKPVKLG